MNTVWGLLLLSLVGLSLYFFIFVMIFGPHSNCELLHLSWLFLEMLGTLTKPVVLCLKIYLLADQLDTGILTNKWKWHTINFWLRKYVRSASLGGTKLYDSRKSARLLRLSHCPQGPSLKSLTSWSLSVWQGILCFNPPCELFLTYEIFSILLI